MNETKPLVLCVDDDDRTIEILSKIMSRLPLHDATATRPIQAVELAQRLQPDLLILDLMLPEMSGWEVLDKIRTCVPGKIPRVIILTAKDNGFERLIAANVARVDLFLAKPFDTAELARRVLRLLNLPLGDEWPGRDTGPLRMRA